MTSGLNPHEESIWRKQYGDCDEPFEREDLVFVYPSGLVKEPDSIAGRLQSAMTYLKSVTNLDPTQAFGSRVIIGYWFRATHPNWSGKDGNRIHIPWNYLFKENKTVDACSHELIHPFYNLSPLHSGNEKWGDCFCEFLRGPVKNVMGLNGKGWWQEKIRDKKSGKQNWGNVAGQFLLKGKEEYGTPNETDEDFADRFIEDREAIKKFVASLFADFAERPLDSEFNTTTKMR